MVIFAVPLLIDEMWTRRAGCPSSWSTWHARAETGCGRVDLPDTPTGRISGKYGMVCGRPAHRRQHARAAFGTVSAILVLWGP